MQANDEMFAEQLKLTKSLFNQGKYVETQEACEKLHATQPENVSLILLWSASLHKQGEYDKSLSCLDKVPETHNKCAEVMMNKAAIYFEKKNYPEAEKLYHSVLSQKPDFVECNISYISTLMKMDKYQTAIEALDNIIKLHPKLVEPYILYGKSLFNLDRAVEAVAKFTHAIKLEPESFDAWEGLAESYAFANQIKHAIWCYEIASEFNNLSMNAIANFGLMNYRIRRFSKSIDIFKSAIEMYPELELHPVVLHTMGSIYLNYLDDAAAAEPYFKSLVDLDDNNVEYNMCLVRVYQELNKRDLAYSTAIKCAEMYILINEEEEAVIAYNIAINLFPKNYYAHWKLGSLINKLELKILTLMEELG